MHETAPPDPALAAKASIVGVGESDYRADYRAARARAPGYAPPSLEQLAGTAFERALADAGLERADIDGVSTSYLHGGPSAAETAALFGVRPRWCVENGGIMAGPLPVVSRAIAEGKADTVAMIYAVSSRSSNRKYGGYTFAAVGGTPPSYYYYHPWGWSSQAAHWAFVWDHYRRSHGYAEADLGAVAIRLRDNAIASPNSIMTTPLDVDQYLAARYVVRPLRLFDLCLVNDGAVCLIVQRADRARDGARVPVEVAGWSRTVTKRDKLRMLVEERLRPLIEDAAGQAFAMAGIGRDEVDHFEGYDAATIHLVTQIEGYGFAPPGEGLRFVGDGGIAVGGAMPTNTGGGMLSGSYMHGWNHIAQIVRQLRHEAGPQQVEGARVSLFSLTQTDQVDPILFRRGA